MEKIKEIILSTKIDGIADYFNLYKKIERLIDDLSLKNAKTMRIAILSSFTIKGLKEILYVKCCGIGIIPEFHVCEYGQYVQEILDDNSGLYKFDPDLVIIYIDVWKILGELRFLPYSISDEQREEWVSKKSEELKTLIRKIEGRTLAKILFHDFETPTYSPLGILENKQKFGHIESVEALNALLKKEFKHDDRVFVLNYDSFCARIGKNNVIDYKMYYLGDMKLNLQYMADLCEEYLSYIKPLSSFIKKCIVLDLDNTLWGGIIGEDGLEGIKLGPMPEGQPYLDFQKALLSFFNRGVILAVNSMNNPEDVLKVFRSHPYQILKEENFAVMKINWNDKISNMIAIAEEINIGTDSLVFIDDNKLNREMVSAALPEVLVVDLPDDPSLYSKTLLESNDFNTFQITQEDRKKGAMYAAHNKRKKFQNTATDMTEYIKGLNMVISIERPSSFNIPRIAQLTRKTNQFNMTTRRYEEAEIRQFSRKDDFLVVSVRVEDKFGDNGICGVVIAEKGTSEWRVDTFLLSCRVIGRRIEEIMLAYIMKSAETEKARALIGEFIPTEKNIPAREFYKTHGFELAKKHGETEDWKIALSKQSKYPDFIKVIEPVD